jgi:spore photoproduct lyase
MQHVELLTEGNGTGLRKNKSKLWLPKRVVFTADAIEEPYAQRILERVKSYGLKYEITKRVTGLKGATDRETYQIAKSTLAVVKAPASAFSLRPIPPSADWQFHLAEGCPAHCQYCYLAGSLSGPPAIRVFANLPAILENLVKYTSKSQFTTFEASCYTDPLSLEHLTGGLQETISFFSRLENTQLRFVTKFDSVEPLLNLEHHNNTRCRVSLNAHSIGRKLESGTPGVEARIKALRSLALPQSEGGGGYPVGVVLAPIMPIPNWEQEYGRLFEELASALDFPCDLTFELITHRFTPGSKDILLKWYPGTSLEMDEQLRIVKRNKFGGVKYVYPKAMMNDLKAFFNREISSNFPLAKILYWT